MPLIEWTEAFSVQNEAIDAQHKEWVKILNHLHDIILGDDHQARQTAAEDALNAMHAYAQEHFASEEAYMQTLGYPALTEHRRQHRQFSDKIYQYRRSIQEGDLVLNSEVVSIVKEWLLDHIAKADQDYAVFAQDSGANAA